MKDKIQLYIKVLNYIVIESLLFNYQIQTLISTSKLKFLLSSTCYMEKSLFLKDHPTKTYAHNMYLSE